MGIRNGEDGAADGGGAAVADIGAEHVWKRSHQGAHGSSLLEDIDGPSLRRSRHADGRAVHVHLAIADLVEPRPGERVILPRGHGVGDREGELVGAEAEGVGAYVAGVGGGAAAFDGFNDFEDGVFGRGRVGCEGDLAGAAAVGGLALEADGLGLVDGHDVEGC